MKKVLVTGASGFIGYNTLPLLLAKGYEVHAISSKAIISEYPGVTWHHTNLLDFIQIKRLLFQVQPSHLLHFAWEVTPQKYLHSLENLRWLQASIEILKKFLEVGGKRVVMAGSCIEYDWTYGYCSEYITPTVSHTMYSTCKSSLQTILNIFAKQENLSAAWGRIFFLYGPKENPNRLVSSVIRSLLKGEYANCLSGNSIRDFLHVEDVADAFVELLCSDISGPVNIASGQPITIKDLVLKVANYISSEDFIRFTSDNKQDENNLVLANVHRLQNELKWVSKYSLDQGIQQTISWWQKHISNE